MSTIFHTPTATIGQPAVVADVTVPDGALDAAIAVSHDADGTLKAGAVDNAAVLAANVVTTAKILDANVTADKLAADSVTTVKILDANVTAAKLAADSVTTAKILNANVTTAKIADANVTADKLATDSVTTAKITDANVTTAKIADSNVTTAKIADANVTAAKLAAAVAGDGLTGGAGSALAVNVDNSTVELNADALRVKDGGITNAKLATDAKMGSLAALTTTEKTSAVGAINELDADQLAAFGSGYVAGTDQTLKAVSDLSATAQLGVITVGTETLEMASAEVDAGGRTVRGMTEDGRLYDYGELTEQNSVTRNNHDLSYGAVDSTGRLVFGITEDGRRLGEGRPDEYGADITHILGAGQSLALGGSSGPALSTTQPYANLTFESSSMARLVPLVEPTIITHEVTQLETPHSGMGNLLSELAMASTGRRDPMRTLHSTHGRSATAMAGIEKGGTLGANLGYDLGQDQVVAAKALCLARGLSYRVGALTLIHGETDDTAGTTTYKTDLIQLQADFESDAMTLTGQSDPIPMFLCQLSSWTKLGGATSLIPQAQLDAVLARPNQLYLVTPKYFLPYTDGLHLTAAGYRWLGEYYAKALNRVLVERRQWRPLYPFSATRSGAVITLLMHVPVGPLVLDTTLVSNPGSYGFEYTDDSSPPAIQSVSVSGHVVTITLASTPTGGNKRIRYAHTGSAGAFAGATTGPRGNLRDSDMTHSRNGNLLYNWCCHFDMAVS